MKLKKTKSKQNLKSMTHAPFGRKKVLPTSAPTPFTLPVGSHSPSKVVLSLEDQDVADAVVYERLGRRQSRHASAHDHHAHRLRPRVPAGGSEPRAGLSSVRAAMRKLFIASSG